MNLEERIELAEQLLVRWADSNSTEEDEIIVKSLRFAADIEKVLICHPRIERCDTGVEISVYDDGVGHRVRFVAKDIYSAARKAVEALEGKQ